MDDGDQPTVVASSLATDNGTHPQDRLTQIGRQILDLWYHYVIRTVWDTFR
jgi:hypothetical protein